MRLLFVTHPEVHISPDIPVTNWGLSDTGRTRAQVFAQANAFKKVTQIWSSEEQKALETARILAHPRELEIKTDVRLGENDRNATGYLPLDEFETATDAFFAQPKQSFRGWETACDAQNRIRQVVQQIAQRHAAGDLAIVSHGAVGTLLFCALSGAKISRQYDQPSQGHFWSAALPDLQPIHSWRSIS